MAKRTLISLLRRLWRHVSPRRRRQLGLMLVLMILAAGAEILSIGAVLPFLSVLTAPEPIFAHPAAQPVIRLLGLHSAEQLLLPFTIAFGVAALLAGALRLLLLWAGMRLSFAAGADLSSEIYRRTLHQSYAVHIARNSSDIISGMTIKTENVIYYVLIPILTMASSLVILCTIFSTLLWVDPVVALTVLIGFGSLYILIMQLMRQRLLQNGKTVSRESTLVIKALQEGLGGIRDVLIEGSQDTYCQIYRSADLRLRRAQGSSMFISQSPRYGMEALGMLLIAILAYALNQQMAGIGRIVPVLGVLALGAQRLLPLLQQAYNAWSHIQGYQAALQDTLDLLDQP